MPTSSDVNDPTRLSTETSPGEHFAKDGGERRAVVSDVPERQGVTGHNVRYVLIWGLAAAVLGMVLVFVGYFH